MRSAFFLLFCSAALASQTVRMWVSSEHYPEHPRWFTDPPDTSEILYKLTPVEIGSEFILSAEPDVVTFKLNTRQTFQSILGIGTSLEETSVYAILKNKTDEQAVEILRALIDPHKGIGMNLFRIAIGTSDFSDGRAVSAHPQGFYSYQEKEDDDFSIQNDIELGIIKILKMALQVAAECDPPQQIKFFASCWSPPAWMKTSASLIGGTLKKGYEKQLALYFRRFIAAYASHGIPVYAMTIQNEPNFTPKDYPGMKLNWRQERDLVIAIHEEFQKEPAIHTKLWIIDHNFEFWKKADKILTGLQQMGKKQAVDAVAFHAYSGAPASNMRKLQQRHPDIDLQFSEMAKFGVRGMYDIQQVFEYGSRSYVYWVTMSTQTPAEHNQGPYNTLRRLSPTMLIKSDGDNPHWYKNADYYLLGQFSRFIRPGALRIACDRGSSDSLTASAFRNPDESIVIVLVNQTKEEQIFQAILDRQSYRGTVPERSVATIVWDSGKD